LFLVLLQRMSFLRFKIILFIFQLPLKFALIFDVLCEALLLLR
jgi:hypothetical protein